MIGRVLNGTYRLVELIGSGGMADVYRAVQLAPPQRTVAVKVLKSEFETDAAFLRRFAQEAEAALMLSHDNIVRTYDVGEDEGVHYIVLEYVEGETLKDKLRAQGRLSAKQVVNLGAQVLDALSHAHEAGIIHRDVKPQNVIVTARNKAKLADFGIARQTASEHTQTFMGSSVLGSVHYLSPEQAKGEQVTVRSDVYSMGVTLYEMSTGRLPFEGESSVSIAIKHLSEPFDPPIMFNQTMPSALNDVICKAMNKNPLKRYPSARAMRQDLLQVLREPNGTFARPDPPALRKPRKRKKGRGILRIMLAAFVLIGLFVVLLLTGQNRPATSNSNGELVPALAGKTVEEAREIAVRRGYELETIEVVMSEQYDSGTVISQYPLAGTSLRGGSTIQITVSGGAAQVFVPNVITRTLAEAQAMLEEVGLRPGSVVYEENDSQAGTVFRQEPQADTALLAGDEVHLYITQEPSLVIEAPAVTQLKLPEALQLLREAGAQHFRVYMAAPEMNTQAPEADIVVQQNPAPGESFTTTDRFTMTITGTALYAAPLSFQVEAPQDDTAVVAVLAREEEGIHYEMVVFETLLKEGTQEVTFTAAADDGGEFQLLLYVNGTQIRQTMVILSYRG